MRFIDKYDFLSNFYTCPVSIYVNDKTLTFRNSEAAFQAQKNFELADKFCYLTGYEAKKYGKQIPLTTPDWNNYRLTAMAKALHAKFSSDKLLNKLKEVKEEIVEDNYWNDFYWGVCKGRGQNMLGKMLMIIRDTNNSLPALTKFISEVTNIN